MHYLWRQRVLRLAPLDKKKVENNLKEILKNILTFFYIHLLDIFQQIFLPYTEIKLRDYILIVRQLIDLR